jgi:O-antigen/teichoic acid export membrane protein
VLNFLKWLSLGSLISIIFTAALLFKKLVKPDFSFDFSFMQNTLGQALPFALMNIFILIYFRIDMVMLSLMKNETVVGLYSASYRIMEMLLVIPAVIMIPIYPAMSRLTKNESAKFHELSQISVQGLLLICLPVTLIIFFLAPQFMLFFYGDSDYLTATAALKILVFTLPFNGLTSVFATMLAANNRQIITTRNTAICAGFNILLNMLLIPSYSFIGAAAATLATEGLLAALCYFAVVKSLGEKISSTYLLKFFLLTLFVLSAKLIWQKADLSPYFTSAVTVLFFIVGLFWLKLFDLRFLKLLSNFLK